MKSNSTATKQFVLNYGDIFASESFIPCVTAQPPEMMVVLLTAYRHGPAAVRWSAPLAAVSGTSAQAAAGLVVPLTAASGADRCGGSRFISNNPVPVRSFASRLAGQLM